MALRSTLVVALALALAVSGCVTMGRQGTVSMRVKRTATTPRDASVYIDEEYVAPLYIIQSHGVRLPVGEHRITVEKAGYFPYDELVRANRQPILLEVELAPVPD